MSDLLSASTLANDPNRSPEKLTSCASFKSGCAKPKQDFWSRVPKDLHGAENAATPVGARP